MGDILKSHRLVSDKKDHFVVKHPDGSDFKIAKRGLDPLTHQKISKLQKFPCGGEAKGYEEGGEVNEAKTEFKEPGTMEKIGQGIGKYVVSPVAQAVSDTAGAYGKILSGAGNLGSGIIKGASVGDANAAEQPGEANAPTAPKIEPPPQPEQQQKAPPPGPASVDMLAQSAQSTQDALGAYENALKGHYQQEADAFDSAGHAYNNFINQSKKVPSPRDIENSYAQADDRLQKEYASKQINPNRLFKNMSTGNKIMAGVGVALGAIGSAVTKQPNYALDIINRAIDEDINSQKTDKESAMSLWKMNRDKVKTDMEATAMTQNQLLSLAQAEVKMASAKQQSAESRIKADSTLFQIEQQKINNRRLLSQMQAGGPDTTLTGASRVDPSILVPQMVPEAQQKEAFKEIQAAQNTARMGESILKSFEQAAKENTLARTGAGLLRTPASVYALHQAMQPTFADLEGTVRQAAMDNTFKNITPAPGDSEHTIQTKRESLREYLKSKSSAPTAKAHGIDLERFSSTSSNPLSRLTPEQGTIYREAVNRLKVNPSDPAGNMVLKKLGLQ